MYKKKKKNEFNVLSEVKNIKYQTDRFTFLIEKKKIDIIIAAVNAVCVHRIILTLVFALLYNVFGKRYDK